MKYTLERYVDGAWYQYGTYDVEDPEQLVAMLKAAQFLSATEIRVIPC